MRSCGVQRTARAANALALPLCQEGRLPRRPQLIRDAVERVPPRKIGRRSTGRQVANQNSQVGCSSRSKVASPPQRRSARAFCLSAQRESAKSVIVKPQTFFSSSLRTLARCRLVVLLIVSVWFTARAEFRVATFNADITIPIGHACMGGGVADAREIVDPLFAKGFVLLGAEEPLVVVS